MLLSPHIWRVSPSVPRTLCLVGKQAGRSPIEALATGPNKSLFFFVLDKTSGRQFLVDTGAEVSVLPATGQDTRMEQSGPLLMAANGSSIKTYGVRTIPLRSTSKTYEWNFIIADVSRPLLGADFLRANSLLVDLQGKRLVDAVTYLPDKLASAKAEFDRMEYHPTLIQSLGIPAAHGTQSFRWLAPVCGLQAPQRRYCA